MLRGFARKKMLAQVRARVRPEHYPSPFAIVDLWFKHGARGEEAYVAEARSIAGLMVGEAARLWFGGPVAV